MKNKTQNSVLMPCLASTSKCNNKLGIIALLMKFALSMRQNRTIALTPEILQTDDLLQELCKGFQIY